MIQSLLPQVLQIWPQELEQIYAREKIDYLRLLQGKLRAQMPAAPLNKRKQFMSRMQAAKRMQSIWFHKNKKLMRVGLRLNSSPDSSIVSEPPGVQAALQEYWRPVYTAKEVDENAMHKMLELYRRGQAVVDF